jgi:glycosyltransferase involved in cell wall biosynthesis
VPAFLAEHNVGVAFTPQVPWFEHQPSTKIYEYLHSGLLCIATDNAANRELISENNGVLVGDTADAFAKGLDLVLELLPRWSPQTVADGVQENTWERVVIDDLAPLLETVQR